MELNMTSHIFGLEVARWTTDVIYQCNTSCSNITEPILFTIKFRTVFQFEKYLPC